MDYKLKKEYLHRIMKARLIEDQITLLEQFGDEYAQSRQAAVSGSLPLPRCQCGQNSLPYKAVSYTEKCSRCGNDC